MDKIEIKVAENGFIVEYDDPTIVEANSKSQGPGDWKDPETYKVYPDVASLIRDLTTMLPNLKPEKSATEEFTSAFNEATQSE